MSAENNKKTILIDDKNHLGGSTIYQDDENFKINDSKTKDWLEEQIKELKNFKNLIIKNRTSIAAYHGYNYLLAKENLTDHLSEDKKNNTIRHRLW